MYVFQNSLEERLLSTTRDTDEQFDRTREVLSDLGRQLVNRDLSEDHLKEIIEVNKYQWLKNNDQHGTDTTKYDQSTVTKNKLTKKKGQTSRVRTCSPIRPIALLNRVISKYRMNRKIVIPTMVLKDSSSGPPSPRNTCVKSSQVTDDEKLQVLKQKAPLPHFYYEHGERMGQRRNLPGQPELIRLLTDPETSLDEGKGNNSTPVSNKNQLKSNALPSLYGASMSPPLVDNQKQKSRRRKRKIICKFCRQPPGDHLKWCIYSDFGKIFDDPALDLERSHTADEIDLSIKNENNKMPQLLRSKSSLMDYALRTDLPEYQTLHRDVYIRALADSRARLVMHRTHDFMNQLTKPFVFSYYKRLKSPRRGLSKINGMQNIFGKGHTDFTEYYRILMEEKEK